MRTHSEKFKQEDREIKKAKLSAFQEAIINFCETSSDIDTNKLWIQTTILDINWKSCSITINKFDEFATYLLSYKDEDIIYFNTQLNEIKFNSTIELLDQPNYIMHIITESIRLQSKEDPKTNTIRWVQKIFWDTIDKDYKAKKKQH